MTQSRTTPPAPGRTSSLIRRFDDIELPAPGTWTVAGSHATIAFSSPRWLGRTDRWLGRAACATVAVGESTDDVAVTVLLDAPGRPALGGPPGGPIAWHAVLEVEAVPNLHPWALSGELSVDGCVYAVQATLAYHGVWRRGNGPYGWFVLSGTIDHGTRASRRTRFCFELLAAAPVSLSAERGAA
jgi:hypothetical protein